MGYEQIFEGIICGYDVRIILSSDGVVINLWHPTKRRHYEANLPYELEGKSKEVQQIFTNLDAFYVYFTEYAEDKERVFINENGRITVVYQLQKSKNKRFPTVQIDTEVLLAGPQIKHELKLSNEVGTVKRENRKLQAQIQQLQELIHKNEEEMKNLIKVARTPTAKINDTASEAGGKQFSVISEGGKSGVIQLKQTLGTVMNEMKQFKSLVGDTKAKQNHVQLKLKERGNCQRKRESSESRERRERRQRKERKKQKKRREKERRKSKHRKHKRKYSSEDQTDSSEQNIRIVPKKITNIDEQIDPEFGKQMWITVDPNNQYLSSQFKVQGNKITKINGYGRYQILSKEVIPPKGKHYFDMHIVRVSFQLFSLGIVAQRRRNNKNSHEHEDLVSYFAKTGAIWEQGTYRNGGKKIPNGVEIRVVVDMDKHTMKWYMDKHEFAGTVLSQKLWNQRLVAYLQFNYQDDVIYWNRIEAAVDAIAR